MLKAGIIGLGKMGISHAAIVGPHKDADLVAVCDTSSLVLDGFKKFTNFRAYDDYKKMIDSERLDFVIIASPTKYHYPMVKYALLKGIHTFCEKPFSLNISEGEDLVLLAEKSNLVNQVGYHNHFIGTFRELKRILKKGILGEIVHFTGEAYGPVVTKAKGGTWRADPAEGGGCLFDYASHVINLIQEIIGKPVNAEGSKLKRIYSKEVEDAVYSVLTLESGVSGILSVNWSDETYRKMSTSISVTGKKGKILCDATELKIYLKEADRAENLDKGWTIKYITDLAIPVDFYLRGEEYSAQIDSFIQHVRSGKQTDINTFKQALETDRVMGLIMADAKR
jgi:predicted dehydrogenase